MTNTAKKSIVFCGMFDIGEVLQPTQMATVEMAKKTPGALAIMVGDIGLAEKLGNYIRLGYEGVAAIYQRRLQCAVSGCVSSQLPQLHEIKDLVDESAFVRMQDMLRQTDAELGKVLKHTPVDLTDEEYMKVHAKFTLILREKIIPAMVAERLAAYGLDTNTLIFSERKLRNKVQFRTRKEKKYQPESWLHLFDVAEKENGLLYLLLTEVENSKGTPACRGIMLALFEEVADLGYSHMYQFYLKKHFLSLSNAELVYEKLHEQFPKDPRWKLKLEDTFC
ncbi:MAG: hypothetical protein AAB558_04675 [Patescibacteria group bacterium]